MPLNVRRFLAFIFLVFVSFYTVNAQTSADVMRARVAKAKAYIAVKNFNAAIYELEQIRRESNDATVGSVVNVLLMNSYLEQGDYKRAQDFLNELAKPNKPNAAANYLAAAAQVVKGAKNQIERYRALGLSVADRNLPVEATQDLDKMRQTLETVVEQSKTLGKDKTQTANAMALLEEATAARGALAKDDYDANRWKNEAADAREQLADSRSVVISAVNDTPSDVPNSNTVASNNNPSSSNTALFPVPTQNVPLNNTSQTSNSTSSTNPYVKTETPAEKPVVNDTPKEESKKTDDAAQTTTPTENPNSGRTRVVPKTENKTETVAANSANPLDVGSLLEYATQKVNPIYPQQAKTIRQTGVVKVELVIDERGQVASVEKLSGPSLLKGAAEDAVKKWKFRPFMRDGQPVKATGFVSFNFNL
ncbi:MAG TPA: TonB family protein [Pyrinomonadaceae bacterium]